MPYRQPVKVPKERLDEMRAKYLGRVVRYTSNGGNLYVGIVACIDPWDVWYARDRHGYVGPNPDTELVMVLDTRGAESVFWLEEVALEIAEG